MRCIWDCFSERLVPRSGAGSRQWSAKRQHVRGGVWSAEVEHGHTMQSSAQSAILIEQSMVTGTTGQRASAPGGRHSQAWPMCTQTG